MDLPDYESAHLLHEYLLFHYGEADRLLPWANGPREALDFPLRCVTENIDPARLPSRARALDLGCAVGRSTFELSKHCAEVIGIDYSQSFVETAQALARGESVNYRIKESGEWYGSAIARAPKDSLPERTSFEIGDAHALRRDLGTFDLVMACNLLCRMREPRDLLAQLPGLVKPGGQLILTTPHTWMEAFTEKARWLGARRAGDVPIDAIAEALAPVFSLVRHHDMPFLIREHSRKFQWSVAEASIWRRQDTSRS